MTRAYIKKSDATPDVVSFTQAMQPHHVPGVRAYSIWLVSLSFVLFQFLLQLSSGVILGGLMKSFALTALGGSILASAYYYIYVALQTPAGVVIDRFGPRLVLSVGAFVLMAGCFLFGMAHMLWLAFVARIVMGLGAAFAFVGTCNLINKWFLKERFSLMVGVTETFGMVGTLVGSFGLAVLISHVGWRVSMLGAGGVSAIIFIFVVTVIRDAPPNKLRYGPRPKRKIIPGLKVILRKKIAWINGCFSGLMFTVITSFAALWGIPYYQAVYNFSLVKSTLICDVMFIGVALGCPMMGWLDAHVPRRAYLMMIGAIACATLFCFLIYIPHLPEIVIVIFMFLIGITSSVYMLAYAVANEIAALRVKSASIGFVNTLSVGATPIVQPIIGLILFLLSGSIEHHAVHHYTPAEYKIALAVLPIIVLIAAYLARYIPNRRD